MRTVLWMIRGARYDSNPHPSTPPAPPPHPPPACTSGSARAHACHRTARSCAFCAQRCCLARFPAPPVRRFLARTTANCRACSPACSCRTSNAPRSRLVPATKSHHSLRHLLTATCRLLYATLRLHTLLSYRYHHLPLPGFNTFVLPLRCASYTQHAPARRIPAAAS